MNIDTDTQYEFTRPIVTHICENIEGVLKIDGEVGNKKVYDPRSYLKKAEANMAARLIKAAEDLCSNGNTIFGKV
jgi:fructose-bisphosphate aldolase class II